MPVYKYRSIEDMKGDRWLEPGDPEIGRRLRAVCRMGVALAGPLPAPRGVHKFRSVEAMQEAKDRWEQERIDRIRATRVRKQ